MYIAIPFGKSTLSIAIPECAVVLEPVHSDPLENPDKIAEEILKNPAGSPPLKDIISPEDSIAIVTSDITRPAPNRSIVTWIMNELKTEPEKVTIIIGTGSHRPCTKSEIETMFGPEITGRYKIINHNAFEQQGLKKTGTDSKGTEISLNREYCDADVRIVTGFIEPHFFAGFSGGPKGVIPGIAGIGTIMAFHSAEMIAHENSTWGILEGNPLQEMAKQYMKTAPPHFMVNVTMNGKKEITGIFAGDCKKVHEAGAAFVKKDAMIPCRETFDIVITSNSGYPLDLNLYQAVKGISAASSIVKKGGAIICIAECSDGIPDHGNFRKIMTMEKSPGEIHEMIMEPDFSMFDQWQAQKLSSILNRAKVFLHSTLHDDTVSKMHLHPCRNVEETINCLSKKNHGKATMAVLPQGPMTIPYLS